MGSQKKMSITPLSLLRVTKHQIPAFKGIPNTSIQGKPLMIYHGAFASASASQIEAHLNSIAQVTPQWRYTMYSDTHFHSTTHEVLVISSGHAKCCFGHEDNPHRVEAVLDKGDVVVIPAGVGHRLIQDYGGFQMVGSYPSSSAGWDMCYGRVGEEDKVKAISDLTWFGRDPVYGDDGPSLHV